MTAGASRGATEAVLAQWDGWLSDAADRLMDLDARTVGSSADVRMDLAAAFVCRKAIDARVDEMRAAGNRATEVAAQPVVDDQGSPIGPDLESAARLLTAVLDRVEATLTADEAAAQRIAVDTVSASADLTVAGRLAEQLGQYVQRVAAVHEQLQAAGRQPGALHDAAQTAAALRAELEQMAAARDTMFRTWTSVPETIQQYRQREVGVRAVVERCREKVRPLPKLAVPSVDALGPVATADGLLAMPWPVARAVMQPLLDRLQRLGEAYDEVEHRFGGLISRRDELRGLLQGFRDKAGGSGLAEHPDLEPLFRQAETELWSAPCDVERAAQLVDTYTSAVNRMINAARPATNEEGAR